MKRRFIVAVMLFAMVFGLGFTSFVQNEAEAASDLKPLPASNTSKSYPSTLIPFSGGYYRVFAKDDNVWVEKYDSSFNIQSRKKLTKELDMYGGCYAGKDAYYLIFGQHNKEEDTSKEVLRVVKYNKSWTKQGTAKITGKDEFAKQVGYMFHLGFPDMVEVDGTLYITCGHRGYVDENYGQGHQGMLLFAVDESTMTGEITDADLWHSFSQNIAAKDNNIYILEESEGSGYTKFTKVVNNKRTNEVVALEYGGDRSSVWSVPTYATADDIEVSSSNILCVGTSIDQSKYDNRYSGEVVPYNVYLTVTPVSNMSTDSTTLKWITSGGDTNSEYKGVHLTKINDDRFLLSYETGYNEDPVTQSEIDALSSHVLHYQFIDGSGNKIGSEKKAAAPFSYCDPVLNNGKVVFYVSLGNSVGFYTIDAQTGAFTKKICNKAGEDAIWNFKDGVLTISGSGTLFESFVSTCIGSRKDQIKKIVIKSGITEIPENAFSYLTNLESVVIEDGLTSIGASAFKEDTALKSIVIPDSVLTLGESAFYGDSGLTSITIPKGITKIEKMTFYKNTGLKNLTIPSNITSIGDHAFYGNTSLEKVVLSQGVKTIEVYAFAGNTSLSSVSMPRSLRTIEENAFRGDTSLMNVTIPDGVTTIGDEAFYGIRYMEKVVIPDSVTTMGEGIFNTGWTCVGSGEPVIDATIVCYKDSYADKYAKTNKISVEYLKETELKKTTYKGTSGLYYFKRGKVDTTYTGFANNENGWYYVESGKVTLKKNGIIQGTVDGTKAYWYVKNSKVTYTETIAQDSRGWWYIKNGKIDTTYTGFAKNENGWYYVESGKVTLKKNGIIQGTVDKVKAYWYVKNSKVTYVETIAQDSRGWWYIKNGKIDTTYTGFAKNENGWYYVESGKVSLKKNGIVQGTVDKVKAYWYVKNSRVTYIDTVDKYNGSWWCVRKGKVDLTYTGFAKNSSGWWYCEKGKVNFSKKDVIQGVVNGQKAWWFVSGGQVKFIDSVEKNSSGWWCIQKGKVNFDYTGFAKNSNGWWYCEKGKVIFGKKDIIQGTVNGTKAWWFVSGGQVKFVDSVEKNSNGWWCIQNGRVNFDFTGIAKNSNGSWYCKGGKVQFDYSGNITYAGKTYKIKAGKVVQ